ncbi:MAG: hypothetical protein HZY79_08890 [Rhodoblastus sp.]|nr:MAG: hypothetical protein HZY79_08890 [Rhodoblastus sp.]
MKSKMKPARPAQPHGPKTVAGVARTSVADAFAEMVREVATLAANPPAENLIAAATLAVAALS